MRYYLFSIPINLAHLQLFCWRRWKTPNFRHYLKTSTCWYLFHFVYQWFVASNDDLMNRRMFLWVPFTPHQRSQEVRHQNRHFKLMKMENISDMQRLCLTRMYSVYTNLKSPKHPNRKPNQISTLKKYWQ